MTRGEVGERASSWLKSGNLSVVDLAELLASDGRRNADMLVPGEERERGEGRVYRHSRAEVVKELVDPRDEPVQETPFCRRP